MRCVLPCPPETRSLLATRWLPAGYTISVSAAWPLQSCSRVVGFLSLRKKGARAGRDAEQVAGLQHQVEQHAGAPVHAAALRAVLPQLRRRRRAPSPHRERRRHAGRRRLVSSRRQGLGFRVSGRPGDCGSVRQPGAIGWRRLCGACSSGGRQSTSPGQRSCHAATPAAETSG